MHGLHVGLNKHLMTEQLIAFGAYPLSEHTKNLPFQIVGCSVFSLLVASCDGVCLLAAPFWGFIAI